MEAVGLTPPWPAIGPISVSHELEHLGISQPVWIPSKTALIDQQQWIGGHRGSPSPVQTFKRNDVERRNAERPHPSQFP